MCTILSLFNVYISIPMSPKMLSDFLKYVTMNFFTSVSQMVSMCVTSKKLVHKLVDLLEV